MQKIITSEDTKSISQSDILRIGEIEQDGWAHGIGEYRKCNDCGHIHSKQDIHGSLERDIYTHTVKQIEALLGNPDILCQICNGQTSEIFGSEYIESIQNRYKNHTSFLTTYRDGTGEIQGFLDGYIADFDTVYENEFKEYYDGVGKDIVLKFAEKKLGKQMPTRMLTNSAMCISEKHKSLYVTYDLMKDFYTNLHEIEGSILGIYEASIGSNTHAIYHSLGGRGIGIGDNPDFIPFIKSTNENHKSDIGLCEDIARVCKDGLSTSLKSFFKQHKHTIKEIIEMGKN